ncbi:hypothetical protein BKA82DRAFT_4019672 [Pisolithus tinctorius]|nr:hypothetical protein BKA82DRAFT_4019672 [Pisolithus tinctorius]
MMAEEGAQIYPPIRSLSEKLDIVREWQDYVSSWMHCLSNIAEIWMCTTCQKALMGRMAWQPKDAIANFQYYGLDELLHDIWESIHAASALELMLVAACQATIVTHHYQIRGIRGGQVPEEASQQFNRGNIALFPQDPFVLSNGITFSPENLALLVIGGDDVGVLQGIKITHLQDGDETADADICVDWSTLASDLVTETVTYVDGDCSKWLQHAMKAAALAHALNHKSFLVDLPFMWDAMFPFMCWNILQNLVNNVQEVEASIVMLAEKLEKNLRAKVDSVEERKALQLFYELNVICTPAFFLTLNPHDMTNVLIAHYGSMDVSWWQQLAAAKAFDVII